MSEDPGFQAEGLDAEGFATWFRGRAPVDWSD